MDIDRPGARIHYEVEEEIAGPDLFLCPPCYPIVHGEIWKYQVPYLRRHFRLIRHDFRGNGRSERTAVGLDFETQYGDVCAVLEASARWPLAIAAISCGSMLAVRYAVEHPARVSHLVLISPQYAQPLPATFEQVLALEIIGNTTRYVERFFTTMYPEPHSLKGIEDGIAWASGTTGEILAEALRQLGKKTVLDLLPRLRVPALILHGTADRLVPYKIGVEICEKIPGARLCTFEGGGHGLPGRDMLKVNQLIAAFVRGDEVEARRFPAGAARRVPEGLEATSPPRKRPPSGPKRILFLSSPIGLGHVQRDLAIVRALRRRHPDLVVEFLTADPASRVVERHGERLHPGSHRLHNESAHFEAFAQDHELHAFNALWSMDGIMAANFMVFAEAAERGNYDLWVADEGWDLDYYLHENPDFKAAPYVFLTDFIGLVPVNDDDALESRRIWEKNAEAIDHRRLHPDVRDLSLMIGDLEDVLDRPFGKDLPNMRDWAREHFRFTGYTHHFDPATLGDRPALRRELGYGAGEQVVLVSIGGTRVGQRLIDRCAQAFARVARDLPAARMVIVGGPRLEPAAFPAEARISVRSFVPDLYRHHAAVDLALVQGGLSTTMELAALGTPFVYFPLHDHFEQQVFVAGRLDRLGAGARMNYRDATPEQIAAQILAGLGNPARRAPVTLDLGGTERAAALIDELLGAS
jgi:pimeloyl-ACP methyl ester carboxylesterase/UDP:flavonoid glycosyltransferase YjiC (YdhE family)